MILTVQALYFWVAHSEKIGSEIDILVKILPLSFTLGCYYVSYLIFTTVHRSWHDQKHMHAHLCNGASPYSIVLTLSLRILSFLFLTSARYALTSWSLLMCPFCLGYILCDICVAYSLTSSMPFLASVLKIMQPLAMHVCTYSLFYFSFSIYHHST